MGKNQKKLLEFLIKKCRDGRLIISEQEFEFQTASMLKNNTPKQALQKLEREDFIQIIYTDRHGEPYLYIVLSNSAKNYFKAQRSVKKQVLFKLILASASAIITFIFGRLVYLIFS